MLKIRDWCLISLLADCTSKRDEHNGASLEEGCNNNSVYATYALTDYTMSQAKDNARLKSYKNKSLNTEEMRRRREEEGLQLRKQKKDEQVRITWQEVL